MNLYRQYLGVPFINETASGIYPYKYSNTPITGWNDITTIEENDLYGAHASDYVRATKECFLLFSAKVGSTELEKWGACTDEEKKVLARRHIINDLSLRLQVFPAKEDAYNFMIHADNSISCRRVRIDVAKISIGYSLNVVDRVDLFTYLFTLIESFISVNDTSISDWMHSETGFKAKEYWSQSIEDTYYNIVEQGLKS